MPNGLQSCATNRARELLEFFCCCIAQHVWLFCLLLNDAIFILVFFASDNSGANLWLSVLIILHFFLCLTDVIR